MAHATHARHGVMRTLTLLLVVASAQAYLRRPPNVPNSVPEMWMSAPELIESKGYPVEVHQVRTPDGYLLTLHRIPASPWANFTHGTPLLFGHGLGSCSEQWVVRRDDNLAFMLSDSGYDIWLGNYRGSFYSRRHISLSTKSKKFWDFSWHENGVHDQAAMIDYILAVTQRPALMTLGHSMGSTVQIVLLSERPKYSSKVLANAVLAPPIFFSYPSGMMGLLDALFQSHPAFKHAFSSLIVNDELSMARDPLYQLCNAIAGGNLTVTQGLPPYCKFLFEFVAGSSFQPLDKKLQVTLLTHYPAGASIRQVMHYAQSIMSGGDFRKYDFGPYKNKVLYGSSRAPAYDLRKITSPIYLYYSLSDNLASYKDAEKLARHLPSLRRAHMIPHPEFNHADFLISPKVRDDLNRYIIEDLNRHILKYS